jgi:hypothetical protein
MYLVLLFNNDANLYAVQRCIEVDIFTYRVPAALWYCKKTWNTGPSVSYTDKFFFSSDLIHYQLRAVNGFYSICTVSCPLKELCHDIFNRWFFASNNPI